MRAVRWISSLGLIAAAAFQPAFAEGMDREQLLEQMKAMRPVDLVVLDQTDSPQEYTLGIFAVSAVLNVLFGITTVVIIMKLRRERDAHMRQLEILYGAYTKTVAKRRDINSMSRREQGP